LDGTIGVGITGTVNGLVWLGKLWLFLTMETITTIVLIHTTQAEEFVSSYSNTNRNYSSRNSSQNRTSTNRNTNTLNRRSSFNNNTSRTSPTFTRSNKINLTIPRYEEQANKH
jgi:hypothetical protein